MKNFSFNRLRQALVAVLLFVPCVLCAQQNFQIDLWQQGCTVSNGHDAPEQIDPSKGCFKPSLNVFLPAQEKQTGRVVLICPGGAYSHLASQHEGSDWAPFFNERGIAVVVLTYRMPFGHTQVPLTDAQEAMRIIRSKAAEWNINPNDVGVMGSSAGGHLAITLATKSDFDVRPNFQILFYPVVTMDEKTTHKGSRDNLLGTDPSDKTVSAWSGENNVYRRNTPPAILLLSGDDTAVPPLNSILYFQALRKAGIPATLHIYNDGGHGWGYRTSFAHHQEVLDALDAWLPTVPSHKSDAVRIACVGNSITDGVGLKDRDKDGYPTKLGESLGAGYWVRNFGVSGRTMLNNGDYPYMKERQWKEAQDFNPDIVIIKLGTNDSKPNNWNEHGKEFAADMQSMINTLRALPSNPKIVLVDPIWVDGPVHTITDSVIVNYVIPTINKVAKKNKIPVIDLHTPFVGKKEWLTRDRLHPNELGAKTMAELIEQRLVELKYVTK